MDVREKREKLIEILRKPIFPHELVVPIEAVKENDYIPPDEIRTITGRNRFRPVAVKSKNQNYINAAERSKL